MTKYFTYFLDHVYYPLVKYRLHLSLIYLFLIINTFQFVGDQGIIWPVTISFFLWHYALFIFDRAWDYDKDAITQPQEAIRPQERWFFLGLSFAACLAPLIILPVFGHSLWPYLPFIPITFLYTYPIYKGYRSKNITFFKNLYSALFIYTLPLSVIAFYYTNTDLDFWLIFKEKFLGLFLYVMVGECFWDIRDVEGDREDKVYTLPVVFGIIPTKVYLLALIALDFAIFGRVISDSTLLYVFLILIATPRTPNWIFHLPPLLALYRFLKPLIVT